MTTPDTLPPLSGIPAALPPGRPASAWLGVGRGQYAHHFPAGWRTSACGLRGAGAGLAVSLAGVGRP